MTTFFCRSWAFSKTKMLALASSKPNGLTPLNWLRARPSQKLSELNTALIMLGVLRGSTRRTLIP